MRSIKTTTAHLHSNNNPVDLQWEALKLRLPTTIVVQYKITIPTTIISWQPQLVSGSMSVRVFQGGRPQQLLHARTQATTIPGGKNWPWVKKWFSGLNLQELKFFNLRQRQNGRHFADNILKCISLNENVWIPIEISLKFVPKGLIDNIPALV